jgi:Na+/H+-dicarboxylate symporter
MTPALIDTGALLKMLYTSLIAGVSVAVIFSVAILGAARSGDLRREGRAGAATAYAVLGVAALVLAIAIVIFGLVLVAHKS